MLVAETNANSAGARSGIHIRTFTGEHVEGQCMWAHSERAIRFILGYARLPGLKLNVALADF